MTLQFGVDVDDLVDVVIVLLKLFRIFEVLLLVVLEHRARWVLMDFSLFGYLFLGFEGS